MLYLWIGCTLLSQIYYIGIRYILESISSLEDAPYKSSRWFLEIKYFSFEQPLVDQQCRRLVLLLGTNLISLFFGEEEARVNHTQSEKVDHKNTYTTSFPCISYFFNIKNEEEKNVKRVFVLVCLWVPGAILQSSIWSLSCGDSPLVRLDSIALSLFTRQDQGSWQGFQLNLGRIGFYLSEASCPGRVIFLTKSTHKVWRL